MAEEVGGLSASLVERDAAEKIVRWINKTYENEETNRDYRVALRVFGRRTTDDGVDGPNSPPEPIDWVPSGTSSTYDPSPEPGDMLRWDEDVIPMVEAAENPRDAALVTLAFDLGPRGGELQSITLGDVTDGDHGLRVTLRGKQGKRTATIIPSVPYVNKWLAAHPATGDSDAPIWSKLQQAEPVSYQMLNKALKEMAARAGVEKPVTPTNLRKSSAAHLASKGVNQAHLEDHHGWVRGSRVASRYVSVFAEQADREIAKAYGQEVEPEDTDDISPEECPRCGRETPQEKQLCVWCGQALEPGAAEKASAVDDLLVGAIARAEGEDAAEILEMREEVKDEPDLMTDLMDELAPHLAERAE